MLMSKSRFYYTKLRNGAMAKAVEIMTSAAFFGRTDFAYGLKA